MINRFWYTCTSNVKCKCWKRVFNHSRGCCHNCLQLYYTLFVGIFEAVYELLVLFVLIVFFFTYTLLNLIFNTILIAALPDGGLITQLVTGEKQKNWWKETGIACSLNHRMSASGAFVFHSSLLLFLQPIFLFKIIIVYLVIICHILMTVTAYGNIIGSKIIKNTPAAKIPGWERCKSSGFSLPE